MNNQNNCQNKICIIIIGSCDQCSNRAYQVNQQKMNFFLDSDFFLFEKHVVSSQETAEMKNEFV